MFRRFVPLITRNIPKLGKIFATGCALTATYSYIQLQKPIRCFSFTHADKNIFQSVLDKVIQIELQGEFIGYAFCFMDYYLVTTSPQLHNERNANKRYDFIQGGKKLEGQFKVMGKFENMTFLYCPTLPNCVMPFSQRAQLYSPIQVLQNKVYVSIKPGYIVSNNGGFGIVDGDGEVGSLVMNQNGVTGLVSAIGKEADSGFMRIIYWDQLKHLIRRFKQPQLYLGISAKANEGQGVSIVRITPNSPLKEHLSMGDSITKVNNSKITNPEDLLRAIMLSDEKVLITVANQNTPEKQIEIRI